LAELGSAPLPDPTDEDHVQGSPAAPLVIEYADFECPHCAVLSARLASLPVRRVFRHFPVRSSHPRAWPAACAAEAAARQGRFWEMHDLLFADQGRLEDPHLWERARALGLDLGRFDRERHEDEVIARVKRDFTSGIRAGVVTTPTVFAGGQMHAGKIEPSALAELSAGWG
jgi:protein-disulfide isomerase